MRLSDVVKTVSPKTCYGMEAVSCSRIAGNINTEHSDTVNGGMFSMDPEIGSIHYRAQDVQPGGVFVAIKGLVADGHDFIDEAIKRGASAIVVQKPVKSKSIIVEVENTRKALASVSAEFFNLPSEKLFLIGITGTNGKTTISYLLESILKTAGFNPGVIGTVPVDGHITLLNGVLGDSPDDVAVLIRDFDSYFAGGPIHIDSQVGAAGGFEVYLRSIGANGSTD